MSRTASYKQRIWPFPAARRIDFRLPLPLCPAIQAEHGMLIRDHLARSGQRLFQWRSYVLLPFVPFMALAALQGEQIETAFGDPLGDAAETAALLLVLLGLAIRIATVGFVPKGTSGRNTRDQRAADLNTTGLYAVVRNPLYFGNCLIYLGLALYTQSLGLTLVMALVLALYYERIIAAEEAFLDNRFGEAYRTWAARTPAFFPRLRRWTPPAMPFCLRSVIRREHASVFGAVVALYLIELGLNAAGPEAEPVDPHWHWVLGVAVVLELAALTLKHRTRLLAVAGR